MAWVVDTSVLLDIRMNDPAYGMTSAACLARCLPEALVICPITYIELAPAFGANPVLLQAFLQQIGIDWREPWTRQDTETAFQAWNDKIVAKRAGQAGKRPIADVLIEAFALRFKGLITRNPKHFRSVTVLEP